MSIDVAPPERSDQETYEQYRALSTSAVASLIVGLLSIMAVLDWVLTIIPLVGVVLGAFAWWKTARRSEEFSGVGLARLGFLLSCLFLVAGPGWLTYVAAMEVPEGYTPISYAELQPDPAQAGQVIPPSALELEGKKVFIKGFVYPGSERFGIRQFLLVRDQGDCCFGGNPKLTDRIQVTLNGPLRLNYESRIHKLAGTFHVNPQQTSVGGAKGGVFYHLEGDYLK